MQANTDGVAADAGTDTATTAVALTATMDPVPLGTVVAFEVKGVRMEKVPFTCDKEKHNAYVRVKKWLGDRCKWAMKRELSGTAIALQEWTVGGARIGGMHIKERCADSEEEACAWLVQMGVAPAAAPRIVAGLLDPSSGVSPRRDGGEQRDTLRPSAASSSSSSSAAGPPRHGGEQSDTHRPAQAQPQPQPQAQPQAQPKRSDEWDASSCSQCGATLGALSALVVDDKVCCDGCYAALEGDVQRVDLRIGTGRDARTVGISRAAQGSGSTENKVLRLTRQWERRRRLKCPGDGMVMGSRVQVAFPHKWKEMSSEAKKVHAQNKLGAMAAEFLLYIRLGDAVFLLLDEQRGRAGEMFDAIIGGKPSTAAVRFYAVEVVYCIAPAPRQDEHDDIVRKGMAQFAVLCSGSPHATRWYFFNGDAAAFLRSIRTSEYGNSELSSEYLFDQRLAEHGDLGAIAVATVPERERFVLDRAMFPPRCQLLPGHAWALGAEHPVVHGGPALPAVTVTNRAGASVFADEETVKRWLASDDEDVDGLERCFVATLCEKGGTGEHSDREAQQKNAVMKAAELGFDGRIRSLRNLQDALRSPFMTRLGPVGWAADTRRPVAEMRALLNPASAPGAQPLCGTRSQTAAQPPAAAANVATAGNRAQKGCGEPPRGGEQRHPLVRVYKDVAAPTFKYGKTYEWDAGDELAWGQCGEKFDFETIFVEKSPKDGILLKPIKNDTWPEFRVFAGEVVVILPGFRCLWVVGYEGDVVKVAAKKVYSYFVVGVGEVRSAGDVEGTSELTCDQCSEDCWDGSYHLPDDCAAALNVRSSEKLSDVCPTCCERLMSGGSAKDERVVKNPPVRQAYGRAWRKARYDSAVSESFYPPLCAQKETARKQLATIAATKQPAIKRRRDSES
jgi:hypothetical protein